MFLFVQFRNKPLLHCQGHDLCRFASGKSQNLFSRFEKKIHFTGKHIAVTESYTGHIFE